MTKQCGTCKWWDKDTGTGDSHECQYYYKIMEIQFPDCVNKSDLYPELMAGTDGQNCPTYEERKE